MRVLVIDDDAGTRETFAYILEAAGFSVGIASSGRAGIAMTSAMQPQLALVDLHLPDVSGIEVIREIGPARYGADCIVITAFADVPATVEAMKSGACNVIEKPISVEQLLDVVWQAISGKSTERGSLVPTAHALRRWAAIVTRVVDSPGDIRTLREWSRFVGASTGALRNWCRTARLSSKRSLAFARMLRAVSLGQRGGSPPERLLDVVDRRTLVKLMMAAGCGSCDGAWMPTIDDFLARQTIIADGDAVREVASMLRVPPNRHST